MDKQLNRTGVGGRGWGLSVKVEWGQFGFGGRQEICISPGIRQAPHRGFLVGAIALRWRELHVEEEEGL